VKHVTTDPDYDGWTTTGEVMEQQPFLLTIRDIGLPKPGW
jgi:hypothetical protein